MATRGPKRPKIPGFMRQVLAANVRRLMAHHYRDAGDKPRALATDAGISKSTAQRIAAGEVGATIENIESIAGAFQLSSYQLLVPELDVANPPIIKGATETEKRAYKRWQQDKLLREKTPA